MDLLHADRFRTAIVRTPSPNFGDGLTTAVGTAPPDPERMAAPGRVVHELDMSEARKMDGGLTYLSLRF